MRHTKARQNETSTPTFQEVYDRNHEVLCGLCRRLFCYHPKSEPYVERCVEKTFNGLRKRWEQLRAYPNLSIWLVDECQRHCRVLLKIHPEWMLPEDDDEGEGDSSVRECVEQWLQEEIELAEQEDEEHDSDDRDW